MTGRCIPCSVSVVSGDSEAAGDVNVDNQTDLSDLVMLNHMLLGRFPQEMPHLKVLTSTVTGIWTTVTFCC